MAEMNQPQDAETEIPLKDPFIAGVLAWLVPGLGHFYQGRTAKGVLYLVCIMGTFVYGLYLSGSEKVGWGRAVYMSFRSEDVRLFWICQIGVGLPTVPMTLLQSNFVGQGKKPIWGGFMAPPEIETPDQAPFRDDPDPARKSLSELYRLLPIYFEMGTLYTTIAGLLNILAIYDACCGPVPAETGKKEEDEPDGNSTTGQAEDDK